MVRMNKSLVNNLEKFSNDSTNKICFIIPFNKNLSQVYSRKKNKFI